MTNTNFSYYGSSKEVRDHLAAIGFTAKVVGNPANPIGRWSNGSSEIHVGKCLSPNYRTGQSSGGGGEWVYSVGKPKAA